MANLENMDTTKNVPSTIKGRDTNALKGKTHIFFWKNWRTKRDKYEPLLRSRGGGVSLPLVVQPRKIHLFILCVLSLIWPVTNDQWPFFSSFFIGVLICKIFLFFWVSFFISISECLATWSAEGPNPTQTQQPSSSSRMKKNRRKCKNWIIRAICTMYLHNI